MVSSIYPDRVRWLFLLQLPFFWEGTDIEPVIESLPFSSPSTGAQNVYDTDPFNNRFIIGPLSGRQFKQFNAVLKYDQTYGRPNESRLRSLAGNDQQVIEAYYRFLKCKYLMRTSNQVVYPN